MHVNTKKPSTNVFHTQETLEKGQEQSIQRTLVHPVCSKNAILVSSVLLSRKWRIWKILLHPWEVHPDRATRGLDSSFEILKTKHFIYLYETTVQLLVPSQIRTRTRKSTFSVANLVSRTLADKTSQVLKITTRPHKPTKEGFES